MMVSNCPRCNERFRVPAGELPEDAYAECPWCLETFPISDVLDRLPPVLGVMSATGQPISAPLQVAAAGSAEPAYESAEPGLESSGLEPIEEESFGIETYSEETVESYPEETAEPEVDEFSAPSFDVAGEEASGGIGDEEAEDEPSWHAPADEDADEISFRINDADPSPAPEAIAPMRVSPLPPPTRTKKKGGLGSIIGVAAGGLLALPLAGLILWGIGFLGMGPFAKEPEPPTRKAAPPVDLSQPPTPAGQPLGQSLTDDLSPPSDPDPATAAAEQIMQMPVDQLPVDDGPSLPDLNDVAVVDPIEVDTIESPTNPIDRLPIDPDPISVPSADSDPIIASDPDPITIPPRDPDPISVPPLDPDPVTATLTDPDPDSESPLVLPTIDPPVANDADPPAIVMPDVSDPTSEPPADEPPPGLVRQPDPIATVEDEVPSPAINSDPTPPTGLGLPPRSDPVLSPDPAPSVETDSAETIKNAVTAGRMLDSFAPYVGPADDRTRRLLLTYEQIALTCGMATQDSKAIRGLASKLKGSPILNEIEGIADEWLNYSNRKSEGIALVGRPSPAGQPPSITLATGTMLPIRGEASIPAATKVIALGKIVDNGGAIELVYAERLP